MLTFSKGSPGDVEGSDGNADDEENLEEPEPEINKNMQTSTTTGAKTYK